MDERTYGDVAVVRHGHVALVEMRRPPHNFFDLALISALADALEDVDRDPELRAVVLASEGKSFCAGANFASKGVGDADPSGPNPLYDQALRLFACRKPVVAAVQGAAIGGGLGVAMVGDFRVASQEARFAANFVKIGIHPGFGLTHTLPRAIGAQRAAMLLLTGRRIDGETAVRWGLVDQLVPASELREAALALATEIAEGAPLALLSTRATLRTGLADAFRAATDHEHAEQSWLLATDDYKEGVRAVAAREPGNFRMR